MTERTFTFRLSASGVEELVRQLRATGDAGEAMAQRLINSSSQIGNSLQRTEAAIDRTRAALVRTQQAAAGGIGGSRFQAGLQAAGFQIGDFITQVQSGGNAFVAFAQQGGQLAGALAGGFAGLVVQAGAVAAQFLAARDSATSLAGAQAGLNAALEASAQFFETAAERADRLDAAQRRTLASGLEVELAAQRAALARANEQAQGLAAANALFARPGTATGRPLEEISRNRAAELAREAQAAADNIARIEAELRRIESVRRGSEAFGPPAPSGAVSRGGGGAAAGGEAERVLAGLRREQEQITSQAQALATATRTVDEVYEDQIANINRLLPRLVELNGVERANEIAARASVEAYNERARSLERGAERASGAARELGFAFSSAFEDAIIKGERLSSVVSGLATDIARVILRRSVTDPLANAASGILGGINFSGLFSGLFGGGTSTAPIVPVTRAVLPNATGNVFSGGSLIPFAAGGIVGAPTLFPMAGGRTGLMGEAGPEAIMPLARDSRGRLGVRGGGPNITTQIMVDARGADPGSEARLRVVAQEIVRQSTAATLDAIRRGGSARAIVRGA